MATGFSSGKIAYGRRLSNLVTLLSLKRYLGKSEALSAEAIKTMRRRGGGGAAAAPTATLATGKFGVKSLWSLSLNSGNPIISREISENSGKVSF